MTKRLFRVLVLAAVAGLMSPAAAWASTIGFTTADPSNFVKFGFGSTAYLFQLTFDDVDADFTVDVTATVFTNQVSLPPGYTCVPIAGSTNCILFTVTTSASQGNGWTGNFRVDIFWATNTDPNYPNDPVNQNGLGAIRILHFGSSGVSDITLPNAYCTVTCPTFDPGIGGQADNFSQFIVARYDPVPEPTSLLLLGSGVVGLVALVRRRRQRI